MLENYGKRGLGAGKVKRTDLIVASIAALVLSQVSAAAQQAELGEVRLLEAPDPPAQRAVFEIVNESDHEISSVAVSCQLLNDAGKALAVKVVRLRHLPPGSVIGDAAFPAHVRGVDVTCRIAHQTSGESR
jgi:hypothetical protein